MRSSGNELINPFKVLERVGVQEGWQVADLGCGALGHFVFPAAQLVGALGMVYAVDIQKSALGAIDRVARAEQYWNIVSVWADIEVDRAVRVPPASLDLTIIANNLYLSHNRPALLREATRLTKPGGRILVIEWKAEESLLGPPQDKRLPVEEAQSLFSLESYRFLDAFDAGDHHYALVYQTLTSTAL